ncbi:MAG: insulinase family protein [Bacteroidetes bacterium]|nr:insulinase family protein [Bacteroidota bacterium]
MKIRILALLLFCSVHFPFPRLQAQEYIPPVEPLLLSNGLTVTLHRDTTLPLISVNVAFRAGSARDPQGKTGIANIAGEMLLTGTRRYPRAELLRLKAEKNVSIAGRTTVDWFSISSVYPMELLEDAILIEADRLENVQETISAEVFDAIVSTLRREHQRRLGQPLGTLMQQIFHEMYPEGHPYRHSTIGLQIHLDSLTIEDVRAFSTRYFAPSNASMTISGNFDPEHVRSLITRHLDPLPAGIVSRWKNIRDSFKPFGQSAFIREDRVDFNQLHLIFPTVRYGHPDDAALKVFAKVLNGSEHGVLRQAMVKNNPAFISVDVYQSSHELDGSFWITLTVKMDAALQPLFSQAMQLLASIAKDGVTEEEVIAARNQTAMDFYTPLEAFYGVGGRGDLLTLGVLYADDPLFSFDQFAMQQSTSSTMIKRVVDRYLHSDNMLAVSIVPAGKTELAAKP